MIETAIHEKNPGLGLPDVLPVAEPGGFILGILRDMPEDRKTIVLLRHAKRNSFLGIPHRLRGRVEISPEGISMARKFGESLRDTMHGKRLVLSHTPANRCRMTAESIRDGSLPWIRVQILGCKPELPHPVKDTGRFSALGQELGWEILFDRWLKQGVGNDVLSDPRPYTSEIVKNLLEVPGVGSKDIFIVVAHDIMIIPLLFCIFGKKITDIDFLNGIVLSCDGDFIAAGYSDGYVSLQERMSYPDLK